MSTMNLDELPQRVALLTDEQLTSYEKMLGAALNSAMEGFNELSVVEKERANRWLWANTKINEPDELSFLCPHGADITKTNCQMCRLVSVQAVDWTDIKLIHLETVNLHRCQCCGEPLSVAHDLNTFKMVAWCGAEGCTYDNNPCSQVDEVKSPTNDTVGVFCTWCKFPLSLNPFYEGEPDTDYYCENPQCSSRGRLTGEFLSRITETGHDEDSL